MRLKKVGSRAPVKGPVEAAGAMKMWKTPNAGFSTFSQRLGKLSAAQDAAASFPQLPQGRAGSLFSKASLKPPRRVIQ